MKRKRNFRGAYGFAITLVAALAFLVAAVRFWGVPADRVVEKLQGALILVVGLALLALLTVVIFKLLRRWLQTRRQ